MTDASLSRFRPLAGAVSPGVALQDHPALGLDLRVLEPGQPRAFGPKCQRAGALQDAGALFDALVVPVTNPVTYHEPART